LAGSDLTRVELRTFGGRDVNITTPAARRLLEAKLLKGLLKHLCPGLVPDLISAPLLAREAKVQVHDLTDHLISPGLALFDHFY